MANHVPEHGRMAKADSGFRIREIRSTDQIGAPIHTWVPAGMENSLGDRLEAYPTLRAPEGRAMRQGQPDAISAHLSRRGSGVK